MPSAALAADGDFRIADPRVTESSGLALSRAHRHTVWTVNDSGDSARVFAIDTRTGETVGVHEFGGPVRDVEALSIGPDGRMLVADIGDNLADQRFVRVFWFQEPPLGQTSGSWKSWELAYPDGPHDAETLLVHPGTGRLYVVTKGSPGAVYRAPAQPSRQGLNRLERVGAAPGTITDGVFLPGGRQVALRSYTRVHVLDAATWEPVASGALPLQPQGETIALAEGGTRLLVGSEGRGSLVQRVVIPSVPTRSATTPTQAGSPLTSPSAGPSAPAPPVAGAGEREPDPSPAGRWWALGAGALIVVAAALAAIARGARR